MTNPLSPEHEAGVRNREAAATPGPWHREDDPRTLERWVHSEDRTLEVCFGYVGNRTQEDADFVAHARTDVRVLLDEIDRLRDELAETNAIHNPLLRGLLIKAGKDRDLYIGWSTVCDMPGGLWSRETALAYGWPCTYLDRADATGTSARSGDGGWDGNGFVAEQRGWLKRERLGDYAVEYLQGDREAAYALLEPFEDDTEVRPT